MKTYNLNNFKITINNIEFELIVIEIGDLFFEYNNSNIKLIAYTSNQNYISISNWVEKSLTKSYKSTIKYHNIELYGIYPIDFSFNNSNISVTFSVDDIFGDFEILELRLSRKEKLKKINEIKHKYQI
ncbi:hypothetical protein M0Q97_06175 [Candidatus Dojkabacteria bacterium]|jgi:hypothetical protein|nr:hypothetical protein [Candidatus Dojkabacteria bacterium]